MLNLRRTIGAWRSSYVAARARDELLSQRFFQETGMAFARIDYVVRGEMLSDAAEGGVEAAIARYLAIRDRAAEEACDPEGIAEGIMAAYRARPSS